MGFCCPQSPHIYDLYMQMICPLLICAPYSFESILWANLHRCERKKCMHLGQPVALLQIMRPNGHSSYYKSWLRLTKIWYVQVLAGRLSTSARDRIIFIATSATRSFIYIVSLEKSLLRLNARWRNALSTSSPWEKYNEILSRTWVMLVALILSRHSISIVLIYFVLHASKVWLQIKGNKFLWAERFPNKLI